MKCGCFCERCNTGKELSPEEIASAGKSHLVNGTLVYSGLCHCFCERCDEVETERSKNQFRFNAEVLNGEVTI